MRCKIAVECPNRKSKRRIRLKMFRYGLTWNGSEYCGSIREKKLTKVIDLCRRFKLKYRINDSFSERSQNYRDTFFKRYRPAIGDRYFCAYCGRLVSSNAITVDHLYPVGAVKRNIQLQKKLRRKGIKNINDSRNLVPACRFCNSKKRAKMGNWIIKGKIGRIKEIWFLRHFLRIVIFIVLIRLLYPFLKEKELILEIIWELKQRYLQLLQSLYLQLETIRFQRF